MIECVVHAPPLAMPALWASLVLSLAWFYGGPDGRAVVTAVTIRTLSAAEQMGK